MRLVIVAVLLSILVFAAYQRLSTVIDTEMEEKAISEVATLVNLASIIYEMGGDSETNTIDRVSIHLPDIVEYAVLGGLPSPDPENLNHRNYFQESNNYYIRFRNGKIYKGDAGVSFAVESENGFDPNATIVLFPGESTLTLRNIRNEYGYFIAVSVEEYAQR